MKRLALVWISTMAAGTLTCCDVQAQARSPVSRAARDQVQKGGAFDAAAQSRKRAELEVWLSRFVGSFQLKGTVMEYLNGGRLTSQDINGVMHCAGIGDGPGVHCLVKASFGPNLWQSFGGIGGGTPTHSITYNTLNPAVMLFALDPDDLKIKVLLVDDHSIADVLSGPLTGDTVKFASRYRGCWGEAPLVHCPWALQITAKPDSNVIKVETTWKSGGIQIEFLLRREQGSAANVEVGTPE